MPPGYTVLATQFEIQVRQLRLTPEFYVYSAELRQWCKQNRNHCYIPEWLLDAWHIAVDADLGNSTLKGQRRTRPCIAPL